MCQHRVKILLIQPIMQYHNRKIQHLLNFRILENLQRLIDHRNWNMFLKSQPEYKFYGKCHDEQFHFSNPQDDMLIMLGRPVDSTSNFKKKSCDGNRP